MSHLSEDDPARANALANLANAKKERDKALANINWYKGHAGEQETAEVTANLGLAEAQLADAQRAYDRVKDGVPASDIAAAEARALAAQATLTQAWIEAPYGGLITKIFPQPGDMVAPGDPAFLLEDRSHLYVEVQVSEIDVNRIQAGQPVTLTFDAIFSKTYTGEVVEVGASGSREQNVVSFPVVIELLDADEDVRSGMTAAVSIEVQAVESVLLIPNRAIRVVDGQRVWYVLKECNPLPEPVEISLGVSSETQSQVLSGDLKAGDTIVLNPPSDNLNGQFGMGARGG